MNYSRLHWVITLAILGVVFTTAEQVMATPFFMGLGSLPGPGPASKAKGVSADGAIVVGWSRSLDTEAFTWDRSHGLRGLGELPGGLAFPVHRRNFVRQAVSPWSIITCEGNQKTRVK
jgi:probable HAF family extracellular repeat protein